MSRRLILTILFISVVCVTSGVAQAQALIGHWKFDGNLTDSAGKTNGTFVGGPAVYATGKVGQAISFDGVDDYVNIPSANPTIYTIAAWVKPASANAAGIVTRTSAAGPTAEWSHQLRIQNGVFHHYLWVGTERNVSGTTTIVPETWYHVVIVAQNNGPMRLYVNGKEDAASLDIVGTLWGSGDRIYIGSDSGHGMGWFQGLVDDLRIYNRELSPGLIDDLFNGIEPAFVKAEKPSPADGATGRTVPFLSWDKGETAQLHDVWFGTSPDALTQVQSRYPYAMYYHMPGLEPGVTYYWRVDEIEANGTIHTGDVWSFTATPLTAYQPHPADGAREVFPAVELSWGAGQGTTEHHVYFGPSFADVNSGAAAADKGTLSLDTTTFDVGVLRASTTYFWRVDEVQGGAARKGSIWSFTTAEGAAGKIAHQWWLNIGGTAVSALTGSSAYPHQPTGRDLRDTFDGFVDWGDNYGNRLYGWLKPPQTGDYTFWVAGDDETQLWLSPDANPANATVIANVSGWTPYLDFDNTGGGAGGASQKSAAISLQAGQKYFVMALHKEGAGGDSVTAAWQGPGMAVREVIPGQYFDTFSLAPLQAFSPTPAHGAVDVPQAVTLSWSAGEKAQQHEVYFGTDANAVAAADASSNLFQGRQAETSFDAGALEWNKTFFWRVDEVAAGEPESPWKGRIWSFTTANYLLLDDFESYNDEEDQGTRIYETWMDGLTNGTTSIVGNWDPPFAERTVVHGGKQSMPVDYNNINQPFYAEAELEFSPLQNWTTNGVNDLSLWYRGNATGFAELEGGRISMSGAGADIWGVADEFRYAYQTLTGDGSIQARVVAFGQGTSTWGKGGVMIRDGLEAGSTHASLVMTTPGATGATFEWRPVADSDSASRDSPTIVAPPYWVKMERKGNNLSAYLSPDGITWTQVGAAQTIAMTAPVYLGLCVTSQVPGELRGYEFDNLTTTGNVSGAWKVEDVGVTQGSGNALDKLYVVVEDAGGKTKVVTNPDPAAVLTLSWTEWKIPLTDLAGVNLGKVKKLYIGVGDRKATVPTGGGRIYIDDIRVVKPQ